MGFKVNRTVYNLAFGEGTALDGATVSARAVSTGAFLDVAGLAAEAEENPAAATKLFEQFADALVAWDLEEEDGTPIPADLDGLRSLEFGTSIAIIKAWMSAMGDVSGPLGQPSTSTDSSRVGLLRMEAL